MVHSELHRYGQQHTKNGQLGAFCATHVYQRKADKTWCCMEMRCLVNNKQQTMTTEKQFTLFELVIERTSDVVET